MKSRLMIAALLCASAGLSSTNARAQFEELAAHVPESANALALFNVDQVRQSNSASQATWKAEYEKLLREGRVSLPPGVSRCIAAAQLEIGSLEPLWEITLVDYDQEPDLTSIARLNHRQVESISGKPTVFVRDDLCMVQLGPTRMAALFPGNRQELSRWIKRTSSKKDVTISAYLGRALQYEVQGSDIIIALDLEDAIDPERIRQGLAESPTVKKYGLNVDRVAALMNGLQGLVLGIRMGKEAHSKLRIDFSGDPSILGDAAKPLMLELAAKIGAKISDLGDWKATIEKQRVSLEGTLSPAGLRRVTSLIEPPSSDVAAAEKSKEDESTDSSKPATKNKADSAASGSETALASQRYFRSIQTLLDDLNADVKSAVTIGQAGVWMQKYANRIDRLPSLNVDRDALNYGAYVSQELRAASAAVKGIGITSGAKRSAVYDSGNAYYDRFYSDAARRQVNAEARATGATSAVDIINEIAKASGNVRRTLSQRYMLDF